ncbi:MAG: hypothetical protein GEU26_15505 [Nitrososphaeraceae archaeon]|nr:hypothetical protein [Nitrososphaeraceae archaeon]
MHKYKISSYSILLAAILIIAAFSSMPLSLNLYQEPNHVYASIISCIQNTDPTTCELQRNGLGSSDGGSGVADENEVDGSASTSNKEDNEIPLIIPSISPTLDESENDGDEGDEGSGQQSLVEGGDDGADSDDGNDRASNPNSNRNDDLETTIPSVLPFP